MGLAPSLLVHRSSLVFWCRGCFPVDGPPVRHNGGLPGLQFMIAFFLLTGKKPWRFYERFHLPRQLVLLLLWTGSIYRGCQCRKDEATVDQKKQKRKQWLSNEFDLVGYGKAIIPNLIGFVPSPQGWLYSSPQCAYIFVWEVWGYDPMLVERDSAGAGCPGSHFPQADAQRLGHVRAFINLE